MMATNLAVFAFPDKVGFAFTSMHLVGFLVRGLVYVANSMQKRDFIQNDSS